MSAPFHYSLLTSVALHGALLSVGVCAFQAAQVDVVRDQYAPIELHLTTESSAAPRVEMLPPTGAELTPPRIVARRSSLVASDQRRATSDNARSHAAVPLVAGQGAFIHARPLTAQNQPPRYPWIARLRGWEGTVVIGARIEANGRVAATWIVRSSSHAVLDTAAQEAIRGWSFTPASQMCTFVASEVAIPVRFHLADAQEQPGAPDGGTTPGL